MTTEAALALRAQAIHKRFPLPRATLFGQRQYLRAVDGVDVSVPAGSTLGVVGESGCGKSTLGRILIGLDRADSGDVEWAGRPAGKHDGTVQAVFQDPGSALDPRQKIGRSIAEALPSGSAARTGERIEELMRQVGLSPQLRDRYPHQLSGGQKQRACIARAIAADPVLILLDEAVSALDASLQMQIVALLRDLQQSTGAAYVFISHDLRAVRGISDWIAVMYLGQIVELAPATDFADSLRHPYSVALRSAEPSLPTDSARPERILLTGDPPSAVDLPRGCRFASRCPVAQELCTQKEPALVTGEGGRQVRCHFPGSLQLTYASHSLAGSS